MLEFEDWEGGALRNEIHSISICNSKIFLIVLGFNDTSTLEGHFVSSPREREKRDRRESRGTGKKEEQE